MIIKMTIQQAQALNDLFVNVVLPDKPREMEEKLVYTIMVRIYKKLRNKLEARIKGQCYSITLTDEEAMAYYCYFKDRYIGDKYLYEANFMTSHIHQIDKVYA